MRNTKFKIWYKIWFWTFVLICLFLSWIGDIPIMEPYLYWSRWLTGFYFTWILILFPSGSIIESFIFFVYRQKNKIIIKK